MHEQPSTDPIDAILKRVGGFSYEASQTQHPREGQLIARLRESPELLEKLNTLNEQVKAVMGIFGRTDTEEKYIVDGAEVDKAVKTLESLLSKQGAITIEDLVLIPAIDLIVPTRSPMTLNGARVTNVGMGSMTINDGTHTIRYGTADFMGTRTPELNGSVSSTGQPDRIIQGASLNEGIPRTFYLRDTLVRLQAFIINSVASGNQISLDILSARLGQIIEEIKIKNPISFAEASLPQQVSQKPDMTTASIRLEKDEEIKPYAEKEHMVPREVYLALATLNRYLSSDIPAGATADETLRPYDIARTVLDALVQSDGLETIVQVWNELSSHQLSAQAEHDLAADASFRTQLKESLQRAVGSQINVLWQQHHDNRALDYSTLNDDEKREYQALYARSNLLVVRALLALLYIQKYSSTPNILREGEKVVSSNTYANSIMTGASDADVELKHYLTMKEIHTDWNRRNLNEFVRTHETGHIAMWKKMAELLDSTKPKAQVSGGANGGRVTKMMHY